jgi:hypothetical protein
MHMVRWVLSRHGGEEPPSAATVARAEELEHVRQFLVLLQERGGYGQQHLLSGWAHSEVRGRDGPTLRPFSDVPRVLLGVGGGLVLGRAS